MTAGPAATRIGENEGVLGIVITVALAVVLGAYFIGNRSAEGSTAHQAATTIFGIGWVVIIGGIIAEIVLAF